jgi:tRNA pseudouridine55 synthase
MIGPPAGRPPAPGAHADPRAEPRAPRTRSRAVPGPAFHGLLCVDKPAGPTSHDVVVHVRRRLLSPGAGHLGTLDPGASGLLVIALGAATRALPVWQGGEKTYQATLMLGVTTRTQDLAGEEIDRRPVDVDEARLRTASLAFTGELSQIPPMVSALKVGGERLHALARRGIEVTRAPRTVRVSSWEWLDVRIPEATFRVRCSSGTYVRTLVHDLGQALGCGAALGSLRRLASEPFTIEQAITLAELDTLTAGEALARAGIPLESALASLPAVTLDATAAATLGAGGRPAVAPEGAPIAAGPRSVVFRDDTGAVLALGELAADPGEPGRALACPRVVFPWAVRSGR